MRQRDEPELDGGWGQTVRASSASEAAVSSREQASVGMSLARSAAVPAHLKSVPWDSPPPPRTGRRQSQLVKTGSSRRDENGNESDVRR